MLSTPGRTLLLLFATIATLFLDQPTARADYATTVLADNPIGYWRLGESPGSTVAVDSSATHNNGTYFGGPTLGVAGLINDPNTAADFKGVSGVTISHSSIYDRVNLPFTIEAWVKFDGSTGSNSRIFDNLVAGDPHGYSLGINNTNLVLFGSTNVLVSFPFLDSRTHYVAFTSDGSGTASGYVDGSLIGTGIYFSSLPYTGTVHIGTDSNGGSRFNGTIDEVALFGSALSASQIQAHFQAGLATVPEPASIVMLGIGCFGLLGYARGRRGSKPFEGE